jgi:hypothetical protein
MKGGVADVPDDSGTSSAPGNSTKYSIVRPAPISPEKEFHLSQSVLAKPKERIKEGRVVVRSININVRVASALLLDRLKFGQSEVRNALWSSSLHHPTSPERQIQP